jgi:ribose 5-phosphate isomerase RpiB
MPFKYAVIRRKSSVSIAVSATGGGDTAALEMAAGNIVIADKRDATTARRLTQHRSTKVDRLSPLRELPTI